MRCTIGLYTCARIYGPSFRENWVYKFGQCVQYTLYICAGILEQSMGARNRVGTGLSYQPSRLHRLAGRYEN
jgi:hypothetical protein